MKNQETIIYVNMLGGFSVTIGDKIIVDQNNQAKKPWSLLEYLITFRGRDIPVDELIDLFWKDEASNNPAGALKTLMFRVRKLLEPLGFPLRNWYFKTERHMAGQGILPPYATRTSSKSFVCRLIARNFRKRPA